MPHLETWLAPPTPHFRMCHNLRPDAYTQAIWSPSYTQPTWLGPSAVETPAESAPEGRLAHRARAFDVGVASWQSSQSVTNLMASGAKKASRTYSQQDIDQVNQKNGTVKYRGRTEHM